MLLLFLIKESLVYSINSLIVNKLRTFLSLLGITIGIFAMISVFTVINSLEHNIKTSIGSLGDNVIYIQKWPWKFGGEYNWWDYIKRPLPTMEEAEEVREKSKLVKSVCFMVGAMKTIKYKDNYAENVQITAVEHSYDKIKTFELSKGRYFSIGESMAGRNVVLMGANLADELFQGRNPIGEVVKISGRKLVVIGVLAKEGEDMFGMSPDDKVIVPVRFIRNIINIKSQSAGPVIMVEPLDNISIPELKAELKGIMRRVRLLKPSEDDDFALNQASLISQGFEGIFVIMDIAGIIIGGFSILVGGFGIANIMFVSVKEQTKLIGIQKALGAKRYFILLQFLFEAIILSLIGGILGLIFVFVGVKIFSSVADMDIFMSAGNIITGIVLSVMIGIVSGIIPAMKASKLDPVEAIASV